MTDSDTVLVRYIVDDAGDGITAGEVGWTTLTLTPGHYEMVRNLRNHYANGMYQVFVVT